MLPGKECGERVVFLASGRFPARGKETTHGGGEGIAMASHGVIVDGAYKVDWDGEMIPMKKNYPKIRDEGVAEKCCENTLRNFEVIEAGGVFTD
jgi:hypothetical protein